jgi:hypothetical protein
VVICGEGLLLQGIVLGVGGTWRMWSGLSDVGFGLDAGRPLRDKGPDRGAKA